MAGFYPISAEVDGKRVRGDWCILQGSQLRVRSLGYGALTVPLRGRRRRPEEWAVIVIRVLVHCYEKREAKDRDRRARETARLGRRRRRRVELT